MIYYIVLAILNLKISGMLAEMEVRKNRGLILDKPNWRLIPELTVCLLAFGITAFLSFAETVLEGNMDVASIGVEILILLIMYIGQRMVVNPRFLSKFKKSKDKKREKIKDEKRAATEMEKSAENVDNDDNDVDKKRQQMEEVVSYVSYTAIYVLKYLFIIVLAQVLIAVLIKEFGEPLILIKYIEIIENNAIQINALQHAIMACVCGVMLSLFRIISIAVCDQHSEAQKPISRIHDQLNGQSIKN